MMEMESGFDIKFKKNNYLYIELVNNINELVKRKLLDEKIKYFN